MKFLDEIIKRKKNAIEKEHCVGGRILEGGQMGGVKAELGPG